MKNYLIRSNRNDNDFFDNTFDEFFKPVFYGTRQNAMKTDIKENENDYELEVEMPGFEKSDINIDLDNGYVVISAEKNEKAEEKEGKSNYLRRERSYSCKRSYYVGDISREDIKAKYNNGVLNVVIPKEQQKAVEAKRIEIE